MRRRRNQITFKLCVVQRILSMIEINEEIVHIHDTFGPTRTERRLDEKLPITDGLHFCFFFLNMQLWLKPHVQFGYKIRQAQHVLLKLIIVTSS